MAHGRAGASSLTHRDPLVGVSGAVVILVPLAMDPGGLQVFLPVKWWLVVSLVLSGCALAAWRGRLRMPSSRCWWAFLAAATVSTAASVAPLMSLVGSPQRNLGLLAWMIFAGSFALGASVGADGAARTAVVTALVLGSIPVSAYALAQVLGVDPVTYETGLDLDRARSTWGNASFLGAYLVLVCPLAHGLARAGERWWVRICGGLALVLGLAAAAATGSRGAWLGLAVAALTLAAAGRTWSSWTRRTATVGAIVAAAVVATLTLSPVGPLLADAGDLGRSTADGRLAQWQLTARLLDERPLLGAGPDTYRVVFPSVIDDDFEREYVGAQVPDRAHNLVLDLGATLGAGGLITLGVLLVVVGRRVAANRDRLLGGPLLAALAGYLVQLQVSFPDAALDVLSWLLAGMAAVSIATAAPSTRDRAPRAPAPARGRATIAGALVVAALAGTIWAGRDVLANRTAVGATAAASPSAGADRAASAARQVPERPLYAQIEARLRAMATEASADTEQADLALRAIERALDVAPGDPELLLDRASVMLAASRVGLADPTSARSAVEDALAAYPSSGRGHVQLGIVLAMSGDPAGARDAWTRATDLDPSDPSALLNLAQLAEQGGERAEAIERYEAVVRLGADDPSVAFATDALARLGG